MSTLELGRYKSLGWEDHDAVEVRDVSKIFPSPRGDLQVLDAINLDVKEGTLVSIVGPSGCGKTTLLRILQGLDQPSSGTVRVGGKLASQADIGFVFQQPRMFPWWSVQRNIEFGVRLRSRRGGASLEEGLTRVRELIALVGLEGFESFLPSEISGGMQQRANLARALAIDPAVLLLDEPFSAVDVMTKERLQLMLDESLATLGTTAVLVTHDIREAVFLGDQVVVMSGRPGRVFETVDVGRPGRRGEEFQQSDELTEITRRIHRDLREGSSDD